ncbi:thioredoxin family protein [Agrilactobacillus fermenti]|uniref:thioredoxin family protein n=1 Tax=Agrilactobacillus fermenti TaxID=2586909 RepID=UPI001E34D3E4|nr:thioredoxin family protein [Agrilactobacillus fermenti]MCD2256652.1 thioredoxin family protein [Agrilactobacillus fermenti]
MKQLSTLENDNLETLTKTGTHVFVFTAGWCGDCRALAPFLPQIEADYPEIDFIEVDRDQYMDLAQKWQIFGIPSFVAIKDGKEIGRYVNKERKTKKQVEDFINSLPA